MMRTVFLGLTAAASGVAVVSSQLLLHDGFGAWSGIAVGGLVTLLLQLMLCCVVMIAPDRSRWRRPVRAGRYLIATVVGVGVGALILPLESASLWREALALLCMFAPAVAALSEFRQPAESSKQ